MDGVLSCRVVLYKAETIYGKVFASERIVERECNYSNALSGVFDMRMRAGDNESYHHALQIGTLGLEGTSEGPISKKTGASYLVNYRYSVTTIAREIGLLSLDGDQADFQDFNFKLNFPTKKAGTFSVFGVGLKDKYWLELEDPSKWESMYDQEYTVSNQTMLAGGVNHKAYLRQELEHQQHHSSLLLQERRRPELL